MGKLTLFDVLLEEWVATDEAAIEAWSSLRSSRKIGPTYADDLLAAMRLQIQAFHLLDALSSELHKERRNIQVI